MKNELVKIIRNYKQMNQAEFAEWLGVAKSTIGQVESGHRDISDILSAKIALKFDIHDQDFIAYRERLVRTNKFFFGIDFKNTCNNPF